MKSVRVLWAALAALVVMLVALVAFGQTAVNPDDPVGLIGAIAAAFKGGSWFLVGALAGVLLVWVLRKVAGLGADKVSWLHWAKWFTTDRGGAVLAFATMLLVTLATALMSGTAMSLRLLLQAVVAAVGTIGTFTLGKKVAAPSDKPSGG